MAQPNEPWRVLRALRSSPPGSAGTDEDRRAVFTAALEQAEQFLTAASAAAYTTKPVQLFYALSQAGRAIAAVRADEPWKIRGHGASVMPNEDIATTTVEPNTSPLGALSVVARALRSQLWEGSVGLSALWASLPELPANPEIVREARQSLEVEEEYVDYQPPTWSGGVQITTLQQPWRWSGYTGRVALQVSNKPSDPEERRALVEQLLAAYPKAAGWSLATRWMTSNADNPGTEPILVEWRRENEDGEEIGIPPQLLTERYDGKLYFRPALGENRAVPSPLITWWGILLALSSLARYEPVIWRQALDIDNSAIAWPLEQGLRIAEQRLPELVLSAVA